jgi:hypothetical protein
MNIFKQAVLVATLSLASISVSAELISIDLNTANDNLVTLDTQTGLEWLDLSLTVNQKWFDFRNGGYGFRVPTYDEVKALMTNNVTSVDDLFSHGSHYPTGDNSDLIWLSTLLGSNTTTPDAGAFAYGLFKHERGDIELFSTTGSVMAGLDSNYGYTWTSTYYNQGIMMVSDGGVSYSSLLDPSINLAVSDASVPLPATLGLLALSMLGFSARRKTK